MPDIKLEIFRKTEQVLLLNRSDHDKSSSDHNCGIGPSISAATINCGSTTLTNDHRSRRSMNNRQKTNYDVVTTPSSPCTLTKTTSLRDISSLPDIIRGFILYHMFPYDRSIWKSVKNPFWILFTIIGLVPIMGQFWWLFVFLIKDKSIEHQLCEFIIGFKVSQFLSLGIISTVIGVLKYIRCNVFMELPDKTWQPCIGGTVNYIFNSYRLL